MHPGVRSRNFALHSTRFQLNYVQHTASHDTIRYYLGT